MTKQERQKLRELCEELERLDAECAGFRMDARENLALLVKYRRTVPKLIDAIREQDAWIEKAKAVILGGCGDEFTDVINALMSEVDDD